MLLHSLYPGRPEGKKKADVKRRHVRNRAEPRARGAPASGLGGKPAATSPPRAANLACSPLKVSTCCCPINEVGDGGVAASLLVEQPPGSQSSGSLPGPRGLASACAGSCGTTGAKGFAKE